MTSRADQGAWGRAVATIGFVLVAACQGNESNTAVVDAGEEAARAQVGSGDAAAPFEATRQTPRPNVVVLLLDDLDDVATTPFLEQVMPFTMRLARSGVRFEQSFVHTSICCASRAALLSGRCPQNTNVFTNGGDVGGWTQFRDEDGTAGVPATTLPAHLAAAGYETALFGKYMNGYVVSTDGEPPPVPGGWSDWHVFVERTGLSYTGYNYQLMNASRGATPTVEVRGRAPEDYATDVLAARAVDFLRKRDRAKPFFAVLAPTAPHTPLVAAPRHQAKADAWTCESLPGRETRPNFFDDGRSFADKPAWLRQTVDQRDTLAVRAFNCLDWRQRLGSLYAVDDMVRAVIEELQESGAWDDTVFVLTSDNGYNLGAHALVHKMAPYEESIRVPLYVVGGRRFAMRPGASSDWVVNTDLAPTVLDLASREVPKDMDGRSFKPLLFGLTTTARTAFPIAYVGGLAIGTEGPASDDARPGFALDVPTHRGVRARLTIDGAARTLKWVAWYAGTSFDEQTDEEVYDLDADPWELDNLVVTQPREVATLLPALRRLGGELAACRGTSCVR